MVIISDGRNGYVYQFWALYCTVSRFAIQRMFLLIYLYSWRHTSEVGGHSRSSSCSQSRWMVTGRSSRDRWMVAGRSSRAPLSQSLPRGGRGSRDLERKKSGDEVCLFLNKEGKLQSCIWLFTEIVDTQRQRSQYSEYNFSSISQKKLKRTCLLSAQSAILPTVTVYPSLCSGLPLR